MFFSKMGRQIGLAVMFFVLLIEAVILITSYHSKKIELNELKYMLEQDVLEKTGEDFHQLHPGILDDAHIDLLMSEFVFNVIILSVIIGLLSALGTMHIFNIHVGKHIVRLKRLNDMNRGLKVARWKITGEEIPQNEVGDLILARESLLNRIEEMENKS